MAKSNPSENGKGINRSDAIRDYLALNPKATSKEITAALAEKGIKVASSLIYFVKSKASQKRKKARREKVAETFRESGSPNPLDLVIRVKSLANEVGGIKQLKRLGDLLAE